MSRIIPPPRPVATDSTRTPNRSILFRTASIPPVKPNAKVPMRLSISISSISFHTFRMPNFRRYQITEQDSIILPGFKGWGTRLRGEKGGRGSFAETFQEPVNDLGARLASVRDLGSW